MTKKRFEKWKIFRNLAENQLIMGEIANELFEKWVSETYPLMTSVDFVELDYHDMKAFGAWMLLKSAESAKNIRHQAAEIALSVGVTKSGDMAHQDIMNLKFELK